jgi:hypothetical protein
MFFKNTDEKVYVDEHNQLGYGADGMVDLHQLKRVTGKIMSILQ